MLDVYVVKSDETRELAYSFPEYVHSFIFNGAGIDVYSKFAHLRRMCDYYADASYTGEELPRVIEDIDRLRPMLDGDKDARRASDTFLSVCMNAHAHGNTITLVCD
jgi:hypothetical protein